MTYDEFLARANEVQQLDKRLAGQLRALYVERGTLQQLVRAILDQRRDLSSAMESADMISEDAVRKAIGIQGQIRGVDTVLMLIHELMTKEEDNVHLAA